MKYESILKTKFAKKRITILYLQLWGKMWHYMVDGLQCRIDYVSPTFQIINCLELARDTTHKTSFYSKCMWATIYLCADREKEWGRQAICVKLVVVCSFLRIVLAAVIAISIFAKVIVEYFCFDWVKKTKRVFDSQSNTLISRYVLSFLP